MTVSLSINWGNNQNISIDIMHIFHFVEVRFNTATDSIMLRASKADMITMLQGIIERLQDKPPGIKHPQPVTALEVDDFFSLPFNHPVRRAFVGQAGIAEMVDKLASNPNTAQIIKDLPTWMKREAGILPKKEKAPKLDLGTFSALRKSHKATSTLSKVPSSKVDVKQAKQSSMFDEEAA